MEKGLNVQQRVEIENYGEWMMVEHRGRRQGR